MGGLVGGLLRATKSHLLTQFHLRCRSFERPFPTGCDLAQSRFAKSFRIRFIIPTSCEPIQPEDSWINVASRSSTLKRGTTTTAAGCFFGPCAEEESCSDLNNGGAHRGFKSRSSCDPGSVQVSLEVGEFCRGVNLVTVMPGTRVGAQGMR